MDAFAGLKSLRYLYIWLDTFDIFKVIFLLGNNGAFSLDQLLFSLDIHHINQAPVVQRAIALSE